jgi:tetratricopeptide (TPR) repeat protein
MSGFTRQRRRTALQVALLFLAAFLTFLPSWSHEFVDLDDDLYISMNPGVLHGLKPGSIRWAFLGVPGNPDHINTYAGFFIPLTWLSLQLDATIANAPPDLIAQRLHSPGNSVLPSATVYHLDNTLQHALATCLLFLFLRTATRKHWPAFIAALLWSLHPLRVESVAWAAERKDTLAALLGFLAFYFYVRRHRPQDPSATAPVTPDPATAHHQSAAKRALYAIGVSTTYIASLLAKPMFLTFPLLLLLLDYWPLHRLRSPAQLPRLVLEKLHLFVIALLFGAITVFGQHEIGALDMTSVPFPARLAHASLSLWDYLYLHIAPFHLSVLYPYDVHPSFFMAAVGFLLLLLIAVACFRQRRQRPHLLAGWLWFLVAFFPMIGILQAGPQAYADRFTLLPSIGLFIMLAWSLPTARLKPLLAGTAALALLSIALTLHRLSFWKSTTTLLQDALTTNPNDYSLHYNLALALARAKDYPDAAAHFTRAAELNPSYRPSFLQAVTAYRAAGNPAPAIPLLARLLALDPNDPEAHDLLALALTATRRLPEALPHFEAATRLAPEDATYRSHLSQARSALDVTPP